jgi:protoheme IX farnesyltransferase
MTVFCAVIGGLLACDSAPDWGIVAWAAAGIWLLASAAFAVNCVLEVAVDARMTRTSRRASARGDLTRKQTVALSGIMAGLR